MIYYRSQMVRTKCGHGTFCIIDMMDKTWRGVGCTRTYWTATQLARARSEARTKIKRHARERFGRDVDLAIVEQ